jgi:trimeric autotransporter adhesin
MQIMSVIFARLGKTAHKWIRILAPHRSRPAEFPGNFTILGVVMKFKRFLLATACIGASLFCSLLNAQQPNSSTSSAVVPRLVNFSGRAIDAQGKIVTGIAGATFAIYQDQYEGTPVWMETQNVTSDAKGNYTVELGATKPDGLPLDLFTSGEARWLGVRINGGEEQPRIMLLSVPYALKAGDAQTLGGLPASAFLLAGAANAAVAQSNVAAFMQPSAPPPSSSDVTTSGGTINTLPLFTTGTNVQSSILTQTGSGATGKMGINIATPATLLDVNGAATVRGTLALPATGAATATAGKNSQPLSFSASSFNSGTGSAVSQNFRLQAEPAGNNTASTSGTLNLLYAAGANLPAETGLKIAKNGQISFAAGQAFPGAGTIKGVTAGTGLTGGGTSGTVTLNLDTTKVPQLGTANVFSGDNTFSSPTTDAIDASSSGAGKSAVVGVERATSGNSFGLWGETFDSTGAGVKGIDAASTGTGVSGQGGTYGVYGFSTGRNSYGVYGGSSGSSGYGVYGAAASQSGAGVEGVNSQGTGVIGQGLAYGISGSESLPTGIAVTGYTTADSSDGVYGFGSSGIGVFGDTDSGYGVYGRVQGAGVDAVHGDSYSQYAGVSGENFNTTLGYGVYGQAESAAGYGVYGTNSAAGAGVYGTSNGGWGVDAYGTSGATGVLAGSDTGYAGWFNADVEVDGKLTATSKDFKIDHPLDPADKYLFHASVESSEMMNIYTGNITTDSQGDATVRFPEWFDALNTDFRYQLTVIGKFAQAIVAREIENHQFKIKTSLPNVRVSWQVTGVRQDAWAKAHPLQVEQEKPQRERGFYLHPELFGAPRERGILWATAPRAMKQWQEPHEKPASPQARKPSPLLRPVNSR